MSNDIEFIDGFFVKEPHANAPDFVKAKVNLKRRDLLEWLSARQDDWVNIDIKVSREGKWYASVDSWVPDSHAGATKKSAPAAQPAKKDEFINDDIPF